MEKKKAGWIGFIIIIVVFLLFFGAPLLILRMVLAENEVDFGTSGLYQEEEVRTTSMEIIHLLAAGSYREVLEDYAVEGAETEENLKGIESRAASISGDWGEYKETTFLELSEVKSQGKYYASVRAELVHENVTVIYRLYFNEKMKMTGFELQDSMSAEQMPKTNPE